MEACFTLNGKPVIVDVAPEMLLSELLREQLDLTGTHVGCDTSQCGACVVHLNGDSVKSCTLLAVAADGACVTTIEGLAAHDGTDLHPMQQAFHEHHGLQCGFCTPGFLMLAVGVLEQNPDIEDDELIDVLSSNLCRCTGYETIIKAVRAAAAEMRSKQ